jgi:transaldolase
MKVGVGADHGGYEMKEQLARLLTAGGHEVVDFDNRIYDTNDDYPDFAIPLARDLLTISPELLEQLEQTEGVLERKLDPAKPQASKEEHLHLDEKTFRWMHNEDAMATEKLADGIRKFNSDAGHLEDHALSQVAQKVG